MAPRGSLFSADLLVFPRLSAWDAAVLALHVATCASYLVARLTHESPAAAAAAADSGASSLLVAFGQETDVLMIAGLILVPRARTKGTGLALAREALTMLEACIAILMFRISPSLFCKYVFWLVALLIVAPAWSIGSRSAAPPGVHAVTSAELQALTLADSYWRAVDERSAAAAAAAAAKEAGGSVAPAAAAAPPSHDAAGAPDALLAFHSEPSDDFLVAYGVAAESHAAALDALSVPRPGATGPAEGAAVATGVAAGGARSAAHVRASKAAPTASSLSTSGASSAAAAAAAAGQPPPAPVRFLSCDARRWPDASTVVDLETGFFSLHLPSVFKFRFGSHGERPAAGGGAAAAAEKPAAAGKKGKAGGEGKDDKDGTAAIPVRRLPYVDPAGVTDTTTLMCATTLRNNFGLR